MIKPTSPIDQFFIPAMFLMGTVSFLALYLVAKLKQISSLKSTLGEFEKTVEELDHQARLIVKSDMELKLYQEEVEDKLNKLTFLKNLILASVNTMDKEELLIQINEELINDLGFKKALVLDYENLETKVSVNSSGPETEQIKNFLSQKKKIFETSPLLSGDNDICKILSSSLGTKNILMAPVRAREKIHEIFLVAETLNGSEIKLGEKATFTIICMYLGQCLENIKMFEDNFAEKEELKRKNDDRTRELVKSLREIEEISKAKTNFISSVSHELRTPLTSVKGFSALLIAEKFGALPPEAKLRLEKIDSNVNKLVDMVNALLDIARIESGKTEVKMAPADIVKLLKDTGDFLSPQMQAKELVFELQAPESLMVFMDKALIERALINLINNALKFTPVKGKIILKCVKQAGQAIISVSDTGCGIPQEDMPKLFDEFYRSHLTQNIQGTGLGLSLVKHIIDTHKEKISVESEVGKGTTFSFTLKIAERPNL